MTYEFFYFIDFTYSSGSDEATSVSVDASDDAPRSSKRQDIHEKVNVIPIGLGIGCLQLKVSYIFFFYVIYLAI